jgi:hypothetical protein
MCIRSHSSTESHDELIFFSMKSYIRILQRNWKMCAVFTRLFILQCIYLLRAPPSAKMVINALNIRVGEGQISNQATVVQEKKLAYCDLETHC